MTSADSNDKNFDELLLEIDSSLAEGREPFDPLKEADPQIRERIAEARECMQLLDLMRTYDAEESQRTPSKMHTLPAFALRPLPFLFQRYELIKNLGEGGFGTVYLAKDPQLDRHVAIKIPHLRSMQDAQSRVRFRTETRVLGQLRHAAIVLILDSGEFEELPFLVMEYCDSGNLSQLLAELDQRPSPGWCAWLILQITQGLGQAHSLGILHRDIKPHNVLLIRADGESQSPESMRPRTSDSWKRLLPKLADFGLAKWSSQRSDSNHTRAGIVAGTPQYMAPEQAAGLVDRVSPATDVHGVGLVLYEMLTGQQPFVGDTEVETRWNIVHREPTAIRKLRPAVPRDLETICHRALEKDPRRRFIDANEMAEELKRFINRSQIKSKPVSMAERVWRWCRRHPDRATMIAVILCLVSLISIGGWWSSSQMAIAYQKESALAKSEMQLRQTETHLREDAERRQDELIRQTEQLKSAIQREQLLSYTAQIRLASDLLQQGQDLECAELLQTIRPSIDQDHDYRDFCWRWLNSQCGGAIHQLPGRASTQFRSLKLIPDKNMILGGSVDGRFIAWDSMTYAPIESGLQALGPETRITGVDYHRQSQNWVFTSAPSSDSQVQSKDFQVQWVNLSGQLKVISLSEPLRHMLSSPDQLRFSVEAAEKPQRRFDVYSSLTGEKMWSAPSRGTVECLVSWGPNGSLAVPDGANVVIYAPDGQEVAVLNRPQDQPVPEPVSSAFSPSGLLLAVLLSNQSVDLWEKQDHGEFKFQRNISIPTKLAVPSDYAKNQWHAISFVEGDHLLAFDGPESRVTVWNLTTNRVESRSPRFSNAIMSIDHLPDGKLLLHEMTAKVYRWSPLPVLDQLPGHEREAWTTDFSPDGQFLVTGGDDTALKLWNTQTRQETPGLEVHPSTIVDSKFSPCQDQLASLCLDGGLRVWRLDHASRKPIGPPRLNLTHRKARTLAWSPDGRTLATGGYDGEVILSDADSLQGLRQFHDHATTVRQILWIEDGQRLLTVSNDRHAVIRDLSGTHDVIRRWVEGSEIHCAALLANTGLVALGLKGGEISLRELSTGTQQGTLVGHQTWVRSLALSPDGKVLASGDESGVIRFWRVENRQLLLSVRHGQSSINDLAFSPSGDTLAIANHEGEITLWPATFVP